MLQTVPPYVDARRLFIPPDFLTELLKVIMLVTTGRLHSARV
jgi:hypothetical protein